MAEYQTKIGHTHLKVRDLQRAVDFYRRFLNLRETERVGQVMAFMTGGPMHHEIALQAVGPDARTPGRRDVGLYHVAFEVPDRASFARAYFALKEAGIPLAPVDHVISWAVYFSDPDGNGLEIYVDTREDPDGAQHWQGMDRTLTEERIRSAL